ncbi:MAG TPA: MFS transporter [Gaiellaceae bacterium]|nr:MFS transporter [Gaiellaceae bacterium]
MRTASGFRLLFVATLGSAVGTWMATIALTVDIQRRTNSPWWISAVWLATLVPTVLIGLSAGPLVDRLPRKTLLVTADLARLVVFAVLPFVHGAAAIVALAGVAGIANSFFRPAVLAGVPNLVSEEELANGTSLLQTADWAATALGPVLAGALIGISGPHVVYWINAATFLFSAVLIMRIRRSFLQSEQGITRGYWPDVRDGLLEFARSRPLLTALLALGCAVLATGLVNVSEIFLATKTLHSGALGYGALWSGSGVGLVTGSILVGTVLDRRSPISIYPYAFIPWALGALFAGIAPNVTLATLGMVLSGFGNGLTFPITVVLIQRAAPDRIRGRVFAVIISTHNALLGLAYVLGGALQEAYGARWTYGVASACIFAGGLTAFALTRSERSQVAVSQAA